MFYLAKRSTMPAAKIFLNKHISCSFGGVRRASSIPAVSGRIDLTRKRKEKQNDLFIRSSRMEEEEKEIQQLSTNRIQQKNKINTDLD